MACWSGFGDLGDGRPFWVGRFSRADRDEMLFYYPGDDNWWLGSHDGNQLQWSFAGNTAGFGHGINDGRPFWTGDFNGNGRTDVLFYYPGDGNWWLGSHGGVGGQIAWSFAGNTGRPYGYRIRLLLKIVQTPSVSIDTMLASMREVYDTVDILVDEGPRENLIVQAAGGGNQLDFNVGTCIMGQTTSDQVKLFANRNNAGPNDIVAYLVRATIPPFNGCAAFPAGEPGAIVASGATRWTLGHEVGHVLGLQHVNDNTNLMTGNGTANIVGTPVLTTAQATTMHASQYSRRC